MAFHTIELAGPPNVAPQFLNQHFVDTLNEQIYIAKGTASVADWINLQGGALSGIVPPNAVLPERLGQIYIDTVLDQAYVAISLADWQLIGPDALTGIVTPLGNVNADYIGQVYVDTLAVIAYIAGANGSANWLDVSTGGGGGGGGGGFGVVPTTELDLFNADDSGFTTWLMDTEGPMIARIDNLDSYTIAMALTAALTPGNSCQNRLILMIGQDSTGAGNININLQRGANTPAAVWLDELNGPANFDRSYVAANEVFVFDVVVTNHQLEENLTGAYTMIVTKVAQGNFTIDNGEAPGGGGCG